MLGTKLDRKIELVEVEEVVRVWSDMVPQGKFHWPII